MELEYWILAFAVFVIVLLLWSRKSREVALLQPVPQQSTTTIPVHTGLVQFYKPAQDVKLDFPPKQIGCCPFSKPMSQALPYADVPMCIASQGA